MSSKKLKEPDNENHKILLNIWETFQKLSTNYDTFLIPNEDNEEKFKLLTKTLYDFGQKFQQDFNIKIDPILNKKHSNQSTTLKPLKNLLIENFDNESIWQQLEVFNEYFIDNYALNNIQKMRQVFSQEDENKNEEDDPGEVKKLGIESKKPILKSSTKTTIDVEPEKLEKKRKKVEFDETNVLETNKVNKKSKETNENQSKNYDFFNLKEMEQYLDYQDEKEMMQNDEQNEDDDEEIDYFADMPSDDDEFDGGDEEFEDNNEENHYKDAMYSDFFDPPPNQNQINGNDDEDQEDVDDSIELDTRDYDFNGNDAENEDEDEEEDEINKKLRALANNDADSQSDDDPEKSEYEKSQIKLQKKIKKSEEDLLLPHNLKWQFSGETTGMVRPTNSLLEEHLQFDHVQRPAPLITDETTKQLETLIKQRIKDKVFDDVERKFKPKEQPFEFRRRLLLESEKSKLGLAELYEKEYLKQQQLKKEQEQLGGNLGNINQFINVGEQEENELKKQIRKEIRLLFRKLDSLSAFHYTPRPPEPEVKIINNLPAITTEEVVPDSISDMKLLAPEEVYNTRNHKVLQSKDERTKTDMKRARRLKKKKQSAAAAKQSGKSLVQNSLKLKVNKTDKKKSLIEAEQDLKSLKSSTKFFQRLQEKQEIQKNSTSKKEKPKIIPTENFSKKLKL